MTREHLVSLDIWLNLFEHRCRLGFVVASRGRLSDREPAEAKNEGSIHRANAFARWMLLV